MVKRGYVSDEIQSSLLEGGFDIEEITGSLPEDYRVLRSLLPSKVTVGGLPSGNEYEFEPGQEVKVSVEDVTILLDKRRGGCCGGNKYPIFEEV